MRNDRTLYLDKKERLGERLDDDAFEVNWEFWFQCTMLHPMLDGDSFVNDDDATFLANMISSHLHEDDWRIHCYFWGDEDQMSIRDFISFLDGGGFSVVDLSGIESQN